MERFVSIGAKGMIPDFLADGAGAGVGKAAEASGHIECGYPQTLSSPPAIAYGGTGATSAAAAIAVLGGVKKTGDRIGQAHLQVVAVQRVICLGQQLVHRAQAVAGDGHLLGGRPCGRAFQLVVHHAGQAVLVIQRGDASLKAVSYLGAVQLRRRPVRIAPFNGKLPDGGYRVIQHRDGLCVRRRPAPAVSAVTVIAMPPAAESRFDAVKDAAV